ncbi:MFS transporter, ACS family, hexuronate transporter [Bryocella elongata]|uniref:MFS transporter, ACS family, hexuronate transporter n=1 Tax=Bryocella elongata TaxID=863522 RepID=A0A1H5SCH0_9BACT|nr:MFS transporter [Bryocella elongata]SEF48306.1 MFS transporter, ACS family, hexuronate transporter [Bryocella elongata]
MSAAHSTAEEFTVTAPEKSNIRWVVCFLVFLATTINYMDRSVFSNIEPMLHNATFMGWNPLADKFHQPVFDNNFGNVLIYFQIAYGIGFLFAGRVIDKLGAKLGYTLAILVWCLSSMSHSLVTSVAGFCIARIFLGLGESGNFPAAIKAITEWFPTEERAKAVGLFNSGANVSFFVALPLVNFVTGHSSLGWRAAFLATGSLGLMWLVIWLIFPYNKYKRTATMTQQALEPVVSKSHPLSDILTNRGTYAFAIGKGLTDGVWWFYLFYLPMFLNRNYGLDTHSAYVYILAVYVISSVGSIFGGTLSGFLMNHGFSVNWGRKITMFAMALLVLPLVLVPHMDKISPHNAWPAAMIIALAAAAHQGWSANLFATTGDMFPASAVSTVVGIGGAAGAAGGAAFTWIVKHNLSLHPLTVFLAAASFYLISLAIFHLLVPKLGAWREELAA